MSKKKNDQNFISELLGKLKASYSSPEDQNEPPVKKDTGDAEFQKQLEKMLGKSEPAKPATKKSVPQKRPQTKKEAVEEAPKKRPQTKKEVVEEAPKKPVKKASAPAKISKKPEVKTPLEEPLFLPEELLETPATGPEEPPVSAAQAEEAPVEEAVIPQEETSLQEEAVPVAVSVEEPLPQEAYVAEETNAPVAEPAAAPEEIVAVEEPKQKEAEADPIVIRPKQTSLRQQKSIVIRPRTESKPSLTPVRVEPQVSEEPIRIGKKSEAPVPPPACASAEPISREAEEPTAESTKPASVEPQEQPRVTKSLDKQADLPSDADPKQPPVKETAQASQTEIPTHTKQASRPLTFSEQIRQKTGLSDEDLSLLFELGYDGDLANLVGTENLKKLKSANLRNQNRYKTNVCPTAIGYRGREYIGAEDQASVIAAYVHDRKYLLARLILTVLCSICLLCIEVPSLRGVRLTQLAQALPLLLPILGTLILTASIALSAKQILAGFKELVSFSPSPYSVYGAILLQVLVYDVFAMLHPTVNLSINFTASLLPLSIVICDVWRLWGELRVFRLLCKKGEKNVLESVTLRKKKMKYGDKVVKILNDDVGESFYRISKSRDVTGFFRRFNATTGISHPFTILIFTALVLPFVAALAIAANALSLSASANGYISVLLLGTPISAVFGVFYTVFHSNRLLTRHKCALLGEESVAEYRDAKTLILKDSEMFHTEKCTEIALDEGGDFQNDMKLASALFRKIGSTLDPLGHGITDCEENAEVTLLRILENGVEATAKDRHLLAGEASFLKRYGIRVPKESSDRALRRTKNVRVLYVAIDGILKLHYEIEYTEKFSFEKLSEALLESKTKVAIGSYDPNLNTAFLQELNNGKDEAVRVIKPGRYEEDCVLDLVDSGAISLEDPEKTVCPLHAAAKVGKLRSLIFRLQLIATLLGGVATLLLAMHEGRFPSAAEITLYHLFWIAVSIVATHLEITEEKLHLLK